MWYAPLRQHTGGVCTPWGCLVKTAGGSRRMVHIALVVPSSNTQRIQEVHITVGHILCGALERRVLSTPLAASQEPVAMDTTTWKTF